MKKLLINLILAGLPLFILIGIYIYNDPFKVIYHFNAYFDPSDSAYFELDDDYISTQTLIQNNPEYKYDSYIFGSSRSDNYLVSEWQKHIKGGNCYHFNSAYETLYGVEKKLLFLKEHHFALNNALFIYDNELLAKTENEKGPIRLKHPALSGMSWFEFQGEFLKYFFDKDFLFAWLDLRFSGHLKKYMAEQNIMGLDQFNYKAASNEFLQSAIEQKLITDSNEFYASRKHIFYERDTAVHYTEKAIGKKQLQLLRSIKEILDENHASYKIVINPLYNQAKMDTTDLKTLQEIFSEEHVCDYSGKNQIASNIYNYFETSITG